MRLLAEILETDPEDLAQVDRYAEKLAHFRRTRPEQAVEGLEKANEIIEAILGYEQLHRRFGLEGGAE